MNLMSMRRLPPDCREVIRVLHAYLDGELPTSEHHLVARHLEDCDRCGIEADISRRVKASLAGLRTPPDPDVLARLQAYADTLTDDNP